MLNLTAYIILVLALHLNQPTHGLGDFLLLRYVELERPADECPKGKQKPKQIKHLHFVLVSLLKIHTTSYLIEEENTAPINTIHR